MFQSLEQDSLSKQCKDPTTSQNSFTMTEEHNIKMDPDHNSEDSVSSENENFHHQEYNNKFEPEQKGENFEGSYQGSPSLGLVNPALNISASLKVRYSFGPLTLGCC